LKTVVDAVTGDWPVWKNQRSVSVATFVELSCAHAKLCAKLCEGSWPYIGQLQPAARDADGASAQSAAAPANTRRDVRQTLNETVAGIASLPARGMGECELTMCQKASANARKIPDKRL
jgi:hypothetical protein